MGGSDSTVDADFPTEADRDRASANAKLDRKMMLLYMMSKGEGRRGKWFVEGAMGGPSHLHCVGINCNDVRMDVLCWRGGRL